MAPSVPTTYPRASPASRSTACGADVTHIVAPHPTEDGRYLVCRQADDGLLTALEDCPSWRQAELRARDYDAGREAVVLAPAERPRRLVKGLYTDADAGG